MVDCGDLFADAMVGRGERRERKLQDEQIVH